MGRNPIVRPIAASPDVQSPKTGRDFILQHEPYSSRMVKPLGHTGRAF